MENQKTPNLQALSQGLLNLSGLGLGYLFQKRWKRWGIHFLITLTLLAVAYLTNGSRLPLVWIPVFCIWLGWMAVDGWRLGRNLVPEQSLLPLALDLPKNRHWLLLAVPLFLLVLESAGLAGYYLLGQKSFQQGNQAYLQADCITAEVRFRQVTTLYELTLSPNIALADARLAECDLLLSAEQAHQDGEYQTAIDLYQEYLDLDSEEQLTAFTEEALAGVYASWAAELMTAKDFQGAINKFDIILDSYQETTAAGQVATPLSESWLQLSKQLWKSDDYQDAVDSALTALENYPSTPAGKLAANQVAEIYLDWAADLQSDGQYPDSIEKITLVLDEYPATLAEDDGDALVAEIYYDWASSLFKSNDFGESIEKYEIILKGYSDYYSPSTINQEIKSSYLAWGIQLRQIDNFNQAIEIYQAFQEEYPQAAQTADTPQLIIETQLEWAENLTQEKKFIQALEKFTEIKDQISDPDTLEALEEGYQAAVLALSLDEGSEGQQVLGEAYSSACDGEPASSPAVGFSKDEPARARSCSSDFHLQQDLMPTVPGHFQYVITKTEGLETVQTCPYQQSYKLIRQRQFWLITVQSTITGNTYTSKKFYGSEPAKCERTEWFTSPTKYKYGTEPSLAEVTTWLEGLLR